MNPGLCLLLHPCIFGFFPALVVMPLVDLLVGPIPRGTSAGIGVFYITAWVVGIIIEVGLVIGLLLWALR